MDWQSFQQALPQLFSGVEITMLLLFVSTMLGLMVSLFLTLCLQSKQLILLFPVKIYLFIFRGTPMLVQFFIIYYGSGQFDFIRETFLWNVFKDPIFCAILTLVLNTGAYTTVILNGAVNSVPKHEILAAKAYGMNAYQIMKKIILSNVIRMILPAYSNEVVMILKGTSLASAITVAELTSVTQSIIGQTYETIQFLSVAAVIYLVLNFLIIASFKYVNQHLVINAG